MNAIEVRELRKVYGDNIALDGVEFTVQPGEVFGLIGPNGSGKTTTLRILSTLVRPTSGSATVFGFDVERNQSDVRKIIGYLPEEAGVYANLTGKEYLHFVGSLYAADGKGVSEMIAQATAFSGLDERLNDKCGEYSQGMKRRLLIARVMMVRPKLAILDEPTSGLDVLHAIHIRGLIRKYVRDFGVAVLLSSHNMLEVEFLCDRIALINKGRIVALGTPSSIKESAGALNLEEAFMKVVEHG